MSNPEIIRDKQGNVVGFKGDRPPERAVCDKNGNIIGFVCGAMHVWRWRAHLVWVVIFSAFTVWLLYDLQGSRRDNCERISIKIQNVLSPDLGVLRDLKDGKPVPKDTPAADYYRTHPDELDGAIRGAERRVAAFDPSLCK